MNYELMLFDRIEKIKQINELHNLEKNSYISFSGGKDSTVLHYLIDLALPNNNIPRVFINTGIEHSYITKFVKEFKKKDNRIIIVNSNVNLKKLFIKHGYPFKSKQHSHNLAIYQNSGMTKTNIKYLGLSEDKTMYLCPLKLQYQFSEDFKIKCSDKCCYKLKKEPFKNWQIQNNKSITLTGMRKREGGNRKNLNCIITDKDNKLIKFHPLSICDDEFVEEFIRINNIELCKLYYPPYNFKRTGCKGCPFSLDLQKQLDLMKELLPNEYKQCNIIWKPVYEEYRRIGYRLEKKDKRFSLFDLLEDKGRLEYDESQI